MPADVSDMKEVRGGSLQRDKMIIPPAESVDFLVARHPAAQSSLEMYRRHRGRSAEVAVARRS